MTKFSFAVIWWETFIRAGDPTRLNQLIRKSGSVIGCIVKNDALVVVNRSYASKCLYLLCDALPAFDCADVIQQRNVWRCLLIQLQCSCRSNLMTQWLGGPSDIIQEKKNASKSQFSASPVWIARFLPYPHSAHSRAHTCAALTIIT